jgi:PKD repeat protein
MRREKILAIFIACTLHSFITVCKGQPYLPNPGTATVNSDYGPRNVTADPAASVFHMGIDYAISGSLHGLAVESGQVNAITYGTSGTQYAHIDIGSWRYMHMLWGASSNNLWEIVSHAGFNYIVQRSYNGSSYNTQRVIGIQSSEATYTDILTQQTLPVTTIINQGDWIFMANTLNHLHLDRGYGVYQNPYAYVIHPDNVNPAITAHFKYHVTTDWGMDFIDDKLYGNPLVIQESVDISSDKDLNYTEISMSTDNQNFNVMKSWAYSGTGHITDNDIILADCQEAWDQAMDEGVYPYMNVVSLDAFKYPWYSQETDPASGNVFRFKYNDGRYYFRMKARDVSGHESVLNVTKILDNLCPYIREVEIRKNNANGELVYCGGWNWNGSALVFSNSCYGNLTNFDDAWVHVVSSEPLNDLSVHVSNFAMSLAPPGGINKLEWIFHVPASSLGNGIHILEFGGHDYAGNPLQAFSSTAPIPAGSIPLRHNTAAFTPQPSPGTDIIHKFDVVQLFPPAANFSPLVATINPGDYIQFNDLTTGMINGWNWIFDGGSPSTSVLSSPSVQYNQPGTYVVKMTASNQAGVSQKAGMITVTNGIIAPVADFFPMNSTVGIGTTVHFTDLSTGSPDQWYWDFGNAAPPSALQNPEVTFYAPGYYTVNLIVINAAGQSNTSGYIHVSAIQSDISLYCGVMPFFASTGEDILFNANVTDGLPPFDFIFDFGDGTTEFKSSVLQNEFVMHAYNTPGNYTLTLTVSDNNGQMDICQETVQISGGDPCAGLHPDFSCSEPSWSVAVNVPVVFTDLTNGGSPPYFYTWHFLHDPLSNAQPSVSFNLTQGPVGVSFPLPGNYPVSLCVSDNSGCSQVVLKNVNVFQPQHCVVSTIGKDGTSYKTLPIGNNYFYDFSWVPWCTACQDPPGSNLFPCITNSLWMLYDMPAGNLLGIKACNPHSNPGCGITTVSQQYYNYNFQAEGEYKLTLRIWDSECSLATGYDCKDETNLAVKIVDCNKVISLCSASLAAGLYKDVFAGTLHIAGPSCYYHVLPGAVASYIATGQANLLEGFHASLNSEVDIRSEACPPLSNFKKAEETGEENEYLSGLEITPNPSDRLFALRTLNPLENILSYKVYNLLGGQVTVREDINHAAVAIDMAGYPKGIYFVRCKLGNKQYVRKIILN